MLVSLTGRGREVVIETLPRALEITERTLEPLTEKDRKTLVRLLEKLC